jgi:D-arginine dehydrogenase
MISTPDFVVVGAGIAGAAAAYELAAHGEVLLLEREEFAGYHTTGRSAALYTEAWEEGIWRQLAFASRPFLEDPPEDFSEYPILAPLPVLMIGRADQRHLVESLQAEASAYVETWLVDDSRARELCPVLRPGYVELGAFEPNAKSIDVDGLHQGFLRGVRARGGEVRLGCGVDRIERTRVGWRIGAGDYEAIAPAVVNAAGAWCDELARLAGVRPIGLVPKRRTAFTFAAPESLDLATMPMVIDVAEEFYFKPEAGQFMGSLAESTPMPPHDVKPEEIDVALAIDRIQQATTLEIRHVRRTWAGLRSFVADGLPVVGEDPTAPGFYWLAGQGGAGIMTSPALSQLLAGLMTRKLPLAALMERGIDAAELSVARLSGRD